MDSRDANFMWAVGIFEGEGTFATRGLRAGGAMRLRMTDRDVVERFAQIVGCGTVYGPYAQQGRKPIWMWACQRKDELEPLVVRMLPWLGIRRQEAATHLLVSLASTVSIARNAHLATHVHSQVTGRCLDCRRATVHRSLRKKRDAPSIPRGMLV
jgi:hypothetical protein